MANELTNNAINAPNPKRKKNNIFFLMKGNYFNSTYCSFDNNELSQHCHSGSVIAHGQKTIYSN